MRILYDHQVFSLQDAGGASRYHFELIRNLQGLSEVAIELLLGLNAFGHALQLAPAGADQGVWPRRRPSSRAWPATPSTSCLPRSSPLFGERSISTTQPSIGLFPGCAGGGWSSPTTIASMSGFPGCSRMPFPSWKPSGNYLPRPTPSFASLNPADRDLLHFYDVAENQDPRGLSRILASASAPGRPAGSVREPYLLYVGSRAGYKNFGLLLEAFSRSGLAGDYRLLAVGGGPFTPAEQARITSLKLGRSVAVIPKADDGTLARAYRDAALFVYPSLYEGFGFPPLEAMSLGCPVLVNQTSSLPEICGDAAFYFDRRRRCRRTLPLPDVHPGRRPRTSHQARAG